MERNIRDRAGRFDVSVSVHDEQLRPAIEHRDAEAVLQSAMLLAFAVLTQAERWPDAALRSMSTFMDDMRTSLLQ